EARDDRSRPPCRLYHLVPCRSIHYDFRPRRLCAWRRAARRQAPRRARGARHPPPLRRDAALIRTLLLLLPLAVLAALLGVFALNIDRDPSFVQSVLIDKPAPAFALPVL